MIGYSIVNTKGQVTIPSEIRGRVNIAPQVRVVILQKDDGVFIKRVPDVFTLRGSVNPISTDFGLMRKSFIKHLGR